MSIIRIEKEYSRLINLGEYENVRVGIKISKTLKDPTAKDIAKYSDKLFKMTKTLVEKEIDRYIKK